MSPVRKNGTSQPDYGDNAFDARSRQSAFDSRGPQTTDSVFDSRGPHTADSVFESRGPQTTDRASSTDKPPRLCGTTSSTHEAPRLRAEASSTHKGPERRVIMTSTIFCHTSCSCFSPSPGCGRSFTIWPASTFCDIQRVNNVVVVVLFALKAVRISLLM